VVGGGEVGARKAASLLACDAQVTVIDRVLSPSLEIMKQEGRVSHVEADYEAAHLGGVFLVIGATNSEVVNQRISADARLRGILVNIADAPSQCDFILPAVVRRGELLIAVSTGGQSPALAKKLRQELESSYGPEYAELLEIMGKLRQQHLAGGFTPEANKRFFTALVESDILRHIGEGNEKGVAACLRKIAALDKESAVLEKPGKD
jgi:precorrin-2 dehydrogenase/sirohydrochlorin ferrochelatase